MQQSASPACVMLHRTRQLWFSWAAVRAKATHTAVTLCQIYLAKHHDEHLDMLALITCIQWQFITDRRQKVWQHHLLCREEKANLCLCLSKSLILLSNSAGSLVKGWGCLFKNRPINGGSSSHWISSRLRTKHNNNGGQTSGPWLSWKSQWAV